MFCLQVGEWGATSKQVAPFPLREKGMIVLLELDKLYNMDCMEGLAQMDTSSIDLAIIDPPYNISVRTKTNGKAKRNAWDKIDNYIPWLVEMLQEVERVLKPNGTLYLWHNDMVQIAEILHVLHKKTSFNLTSFCIWDKGLSYMAKAWYKPNKKTPLRCWFSTCEYCLHFEKGTDTTSLQNINSNPDCYKELKEWYASEKKRLGLSTKDIVKKYKIVTGKSGAIFRHYFCNSQFQIPTKEVWEKVFVPLGFRLSFDGLNKQYSDLSKSYDTLREKYEDLRPVHNCDRFHNNCWHIKAIPSNNRYHTCQKPVGLLERLIKVSSNKGATVLDTCAGSASTMIAAINTDRHWIGFEKEEKYFDIAEKRIALAQAQTRLDFGE